MKCFPGPETGLSRIALRILSVLAAVGGIVAVSGVSYYAEQFYYYFILGICGAWSLINLGLLSFKHCCPPGYCIFVDFIIFAASAFLIVVSSFGAAFGGFGLVGRAIAVFVFAILALILHFVFFVLACGDFHMRRHMKRRMKRRVSKPRRPESQVC